MKIIETDDEKKLVHFYEKRMAAEVDGSCLGDEFTGYVFRISGGNDKQGFPMAQGIMSNTRVRLLMDKGATHYRPRRVGERRRRSVRGCIVGADLATLNLVVVKKGDKEIAGLTDTARAPRLGKTRASKIRKVYNLNKEKDDVRKFVVTRKITTKKKKEIQKRPKIQRLVTPLVLQHKSEEDRKIKAARERARTEKAEYAKLLIKRATEHRESLKARRSSRKSSKKEEAKP